MELYKIKNNRKEIYCERIIDEWFELRRWENLGVPKEHLELAGKEDFFVKNEGLIFKEVNGNNYVALNISLNFKDFTQKNIDFLDVPKIIDIIKKTIINCDLNKS